MTSTNDDRPRGVLTPADRAFLRGEAEYEHEGSAANARARIRERVRNGLLDLEPVLERLDEEDFERVFEGDTDEESALGEALECAIAASYLGSEALGMPFEEVLSAGLNRAARVRDRETPVLVTFAADRPDAIDRERVLERLRERRFGELTEGELRFVSRLYADALGGSETVGSPDEDGRSDLDDETGDASLDGSASSDLAGENGRSGERR